MNIIFVRHGESEANVAQRISDNPARIVQLTERGRMQAEATAQSLQNRRFVHAYASEFARAQQTAQILLQYQECSLQIDARINERRSGMDGMPVEDFNSQVRLDPLHFRTPLGESFLEQMERLRTFLIDAAEIHPEGTVLAVSHENPILAALALSTGDAEAAVLGKVENCGWLELSWPPA